MQSRSNFVLAATVLVRACDVVEEADTLGVSRCLSRGDWVQLTGSRAECRAVAGERDSQPLLCPRPALPRFLPRWLLSPCTAKPSTSELCNYPWGSPPKTDDGVVSKEVAERFN